MAERRMFAKTIIDSDAFLDMPSTARLLYYDLSMRADDEGFVNNPKKIVRMTGASEDDLRVLITKNFVITFESGVIVIKHWKIHNYIRKDRLKATVYVEERAMLDDKDNDAYTLIQGKNNPLNAAKNSLLKEAKKSNVSQMSVKCQSSDSIGKDRLGKDSIVKDSIVKNNGQNSFDLFWSLYPRKVKKQESLKVWLKLFKNDNEKLFNEIMSGLQVAIKSLEWTKDGGRFIPHPPTFLRGERWNDDYTPKGVNSFKDLLEGEND